MFAGSNRMSPPVKYSILIGGLISLMIKAGSLQADPLLQFDSQHQAAKWILNRMNPQSVQDNREIGGYIFRNKEGLYGTTEPFYGNHGNIEFPPPRDEIPEDSKVTASWHTHGASMPNIVSETFSPQDIKLNQRYSIDGYLATPKGQFKYYQLNNPKIVNLGRINN